ncbi:hypothetical protein PG994_007048 [Apiospora phragmitis]|uniref:Uncharacterized protein n=1 Tax=Apiospora phragmitis TaxID=2905665 RepID=A0ABR1UZQ4_9PEZI
MSSSSPDQPATSEAAAPKADSGIASNEQAPLDQAKDKAAEVSGGAAHHDASESTGPTLPLKSHFKGMPKDWEKNRSKTFRYPLDTLFFKSLRRLQSTTRLLILFLSLG